MVFHHESGLLVAQYLLSGHPVPIAEPDRGMGRAPELRLQAWTLGLTRWKLLARRQSKCGRRTKSARPSGELPPRGYGRGPNCQTPVSEIELQRGRVYPVRRILSERLGCLAVFVVGQT